MSVALSDNIIKLLKKQKNLLAFSAGVDSSALFYLLLDAKVDFDVSCVNYKTRENSDLEAEHVRALAEKFKIKAFIKEVRLTGGDFENKARFERYKFFEELILKYSYNNLILAHQLDDRLEWFMMQFCKGAGISELSGFDEFEQRKTYKLVRPLWEISKEDLRAYLEQNNLKFFEDESNLNEKYKRNFFRKNITQALIKNYKNGILNSLRYVRADAKILKGVFVYQQKDFFVYKLNSDLINIRLIDQACKKLGVLLSFASRQEALKQNAVLNRKIAVGKNDKYGFIAPFVSLDRTLPKAFKEKCRFYCIPKHVRAYMYEENIDIFSQFENPNEFDHEMPS